MLSRFNWTMGIWRDADYPHTLNQAANGASGWRGLPSHAWEGTWRGFLFRGTRDEPHACRNQSAACGRFFSGPQRKNRIAFISSNCHTASDRDSFVALLMASLPVDSLGVFSVFFLVVCCVLFLFNTQIVQPHCHTD
jgi:hypothetical protein